MKDKDIMIIGGLGLGALLFGPRIAQTLAGEGGGAGATPADPLHRFFGEPATIITEALQDTPLAPLAEPIRNVTEYVYNILPPAYPELPTPIFPPAPVYEPPPVTDGVTNGDGYTKKELFAPAMTAPSRPTLTDLMQTQAPAGYTAGTPSLFDVAVQQVKAHSVTQWGAPAPTPGRTWYERVLGYTEPGPGPSIGDFSAFGFPTAEYTFKKEATAATAPAPSWQPAPAGQVSYAAPGAPTGFVRGILSR